MAPHLLLNIVFYAEVYMSRSARHTVNITVSPVYNHSCHLRSDKDVLSTLHLYCDTVFTDKETEIQDGLSLGPSFQEAEKGSEPR